MRKFHLIGEPNFDQPAIYVDAYGNPVDAPPTWDAEAGGGSQQVYTDYWQNKIDLSQMYDAEAGGGYNQPLTPTTPAAALYPDANLHVMVTPEQLQPRETVTVAVQPLAPYTGQTLPAVTGPTMSIQPISPETARAVEVPQLTPTTATQPTGPYVTIPGYYSSPAPSMVSVVEKQTAAPAAVSESKSAVPLLVLAALALFAGG